MTATIDHHGNKGDDDEKTDKVDRYDCIETIAQISGTIALNDSDRDHVGRDESNRRIYTLLKSNGGHRPISDHHIVTMAAAFHDVRCIDVLRTCTWKLFLLLVGHDGLDRRTIDPKLSIMKKQLVTYEINGSDELPLSHLVANRSALYHDW